MTATVVTTSAALSKKKNEPNVEVLLGIGIVLGTLEPLSDHFPFYRLLVLFGVYTWLVQLPLYFRIICIVNSFVSADRRATARTTTSLSHAAIRQKKGPLSTFFYTSMFFCGNGCCFHVRSAVVFADRFTFLFDAFSLRCSAEGTLSSLFVSPAALQLLFHCFVSRNCPFELRFAFFLF